ncbi:MAG: sulfite exporter TauE/SafE family protein [Myxococcales bacterium]|nr:MAG: sulfite exporter TauE/SafE family protein [Myxococcales bacterium]
MSLSLLLPVISAGMLGSLHCLGMCGGLVAVASDGAVTWRERVKVQGAYQSARLLGYVALGAAAGALGHAVDLAGRAAGIGKVAAFVAGATMITWGLLAMLSAAGVRLDRKLPRIRLLPSSLRVALAGARPRSPLLRASLLGGASALLPCGFLYAFAIAGAATGSPIGGALVMTALWLGNLPALLGFSWLLAGALARVKRYIPLLSAVSVFALGVLTLNSRINLPALAVASITNPSVTATAPGPMPADCPYHRKNAP